MTYWKKGIWFKESSSSVDVGGATELCKIVAFSLCDWLSLRDCTNCRAFLCVLMRDIKAIWFLLIDIKVIWFFSDWHQTLYHCQGSNLTWVLVGWPWWFVVASNVTTLYVLLCCFSVVFGWYMLFCLARSVGSPLLLGAGRLFLCSFPLFVVMSLAFILESSPLCIICSWYVLLLNLKKNKTLYHCIRASTIIFLGSLSWYEWMGLVQSMGMILWLSSYGCRELRMTS